MYDYMLQFFKLQSGSEQCLSLIFKNMPLRSHVDLPAEKLLVGFDARKGVHFFFGDQDWMDK